MFASNSRRPISEDLPSSTEAQQFLALVALDIFLDVAATAARVLAAARARRHQKYPSCFFLSIDAEPSLSTPRPSRSEFLVDNISRITAGTSAAVLIVAPVSG